MSDEEQQKAVNKILARFPGPVHIFPNRFRFTFTLAILSALSLGFFVLVPMWWWMLDIWFLYIALLVLIWIAGMTRLLLIRKPILILDRKGITTNGIVGWQQNADWKDVESCTIDEELGANVLVVARDRSPRRWRDHKTINISWFIDPHYDALVRLLTLWRERALQAKS